MKASLRIAALSFVVALAMGLVTLSRAENYPTGAASAAAAPAETLKPGFKQIPEDLVADANVSLYSKYIWRGFELSKDSLVIFPTLTVGYKGFSINTWVDLDTRYYTNAINGSNGADRELKIQETDLTLAYSSSVEIKPVNLSYSVGWIYYNYQPGKNQELYASVGLDCILRPTLGIYGEIESGEAWYFLLGLAHSVPVYKDWSLDLAGTVSYQNRRGTSEKFDNWHDGNIAVDLKIPLNKYLSVMPKIQYSFPLSDDAKHRIENASFNGHDSDFVYGGIIFDLAI